MKIWEFHSLLIAKWHSCSNHLNLEIEAEYLMKNLSYLNLNIYRTKNGRNKLWKVLAQGRVIELTDHFHFTQITEKKKLAISPQKLAIFNIYNVFAPFAKLCGSRFLYYFSLCDVRNEAVFLLLEHSSLRQVKQKKHEEKHEILAFKLLLQEIWWKNLTSRKIFKVLKVFCCQSLQKWSKIELCSPPYIFIQNLQQSHLRDSHMKFMGKIKSIIPCEQNYVAWLVKNSKTVFS